jgi:hypothetical protein
MATDFNKTANDFLNSPAGAKLSGKKGELDKLINSPAGQNVKNMISQDEAALMTALENGDMAVLKKALTNILNTEDGSKIAEQVIKLMN